MVRVHVRPVPSQEPDQPAKSLMWSGVAVSVTTSKLGMFALHVPGQSMAGGAETTVPPPEPASVTTSGKAVVVNEAVTLRSPSNLSTHVPVPVQSPLQPPKMRPTSGVAVSVSSVPAG